MMKLKVEWFEVFEDDSDTMSAEAIVREACDSSSHYKYSHASGSKYHKRN